MALHRPETEMLPLFPSLSSREACLCVPDLWPEGWASGLTHIQGAYLGTLRARSLGYTIFALPSPAIACQYLPERSLYTCMEPPFFQLQGTPPDHLALMAGQQGYAHSPKGLCIPVHSLKAAA